MSTERRITVDPQTASDERRRANAMDLAIRSQQPGERPSALVERANAIYEYLRDGVGTKAVGTHGQNVLVRTGSGVIFDAGVTGSIEWRENGVATLTFPIEGELRSLIDFKTSLDSIDHFTVKPVLRASTP